MPLIEVTPPMGIGLPVAFCPVFSPQSGLAKAGAAPSNSPSARPPIKSEKIRFMLSSPVWVLFGDLRRYGDLHDPKLRFYVQGASGVNQLSPRMMTRNAD